MMNQKFPARVRLKKRSDFVRVQSAGEKYHSKHFLMITTRAEPQTLRFGITITKKIDPRSVVRNRLKRRIRDFLRRNRFRFRSGFDIVIVAKRGAQSCSSEEIGKELLGTLKRSDLMQS